MYWRIAIDFKVVTILPGICYCYDKIVRLCSAKYCELHDIVHSKTNVFTIILYITNKTVIIFS